MWKGGWILCGAAWALAAVAATENVPLSEHMAEHFARATQAQSAVIAGDLEQARAQARWLVEHPAADAFPENAVEEMRAGAQAVVDAGHLLDAARGVGRIGAACGHCHELMQVDPGLESEVPMDLGEVLPARMARHQWAADRLWEGLINPSDRAWGLGAEVLQEAPLSGADVIARDDDTVALLGRQLKEFAKQAQISYDRDRRAEVYGELLGRCVGCHRAFRD